MSEPKSEGITYLRYAVNAQKKRPKVKFVTIPMEKAEQIIKQAEGFSPAKVGVWSQKSNSVKAAALCLGLETKELIEKLENPPIAKLLNDLAEAKCKLKAYEEAGDAMFTYLKRQDGTTNGMIKCRADWYSLRTNK